MDEVLRDALAPVLRDLERTTSLRPLLIDDDWTQDPDWPSAMLTDSDGDSDGTGFGVSVGRVMAPLEQVIWVSDLVQDWAAESLQSQAATNWPVCPFHPRTHPMEAAAHEERAVWFCPENETIVDEIGSLTPMPSRKP